MWSCKYNKCVQCGTTDIKHYAKGLCKKCYSRIYSKKRYHKNPQRREYVLMKSKEYRLKNQEKTNEYSKNYMRKKRKNMDPISKARLQKEYTKMETETKVKIKSLFGESCVLCGNINSLYKHEIYGKRHKIAPGYYINHSSDFVLLCRECHNTVHLFLGNGSSWEYVKNNFKKLKQENNIS